jgi:hypothetical protein
MEKAAKNAAKNVEEYLNEFPEKVWVALEELRRSIKTAASQAEESIRYRIPTYKYLGPLVHFAGFKDHCSFIERCLGGKIEAMMSFADTQAEKDVPANWRNKILHTSLIVGSQYLMGSDAPPGRYDKPQSFPFRFRLIALRKPTAFSMPWQKKEPCACPLQRLFGPNDLACLSITSAYPGLLITARPNNGTVGMNALKS